jgi:hypothetical protein
MSMRVFVPRATPFNYSSFHHFAPETHPVNRAAGMFHLPPNFIKLKLHPLPYARSRISLLRPRALFPHASFAQFCP